MISNEQMPLRMSRLIKSKAESLDPPAVAGRGMAQDGRKSLELITRNISSLFGGEIAGQQDDAEIKERQNDKQAGDDVTSLQTLVSDKTLRRPDRAAGAC